MENTIKYFSEVIKSQGLSGLLAIIIWVYGSQYAETLAKIQEQIVQIRVQLASINQKYAQKSAVRELIDQKIAQHLQLFHNEKNSK